ncbi:unnamed protein product [Rhizophagus irregularis]|uniref:Uncharacterized protein n=1 Tax=Rhizophagus irregularis TaxID=588596 RepID=A0A915YPC2_9GLOM|nr:unnamed protein product [Rhizophagus irregularis]
MKRYVKLGYDVISGDDIELAVKDKQDSTQSESRQEYVNQILSDLTNLENNRSLETKSEQTFTSGWALKENEKTRQRGPVKRISSQVKYLLESMFHTGTANPRQKLNAQQMHEELLKRAELGEIEENDIPKVTTITNWISTFSRKWKEAMALRTLKENMDSENS